MSNEHEHSSLLLCLGPSLPPEHVYGSELNAASTSITRSQPTPTATYERQPSQSADVRDICLKQNKDDTEYTSDEKVSGEPISLMGVCGINQDNVESTGETWEEERPSLRCVLSVPRT
jgi:hypothetical protein